MSGRRPIGFITNLGRQLLAGTRTGGVGGVGGVGGGVGGVGGGVGGVGGAGGGLLSAFFRCSQRQAVMNRMMSTAAKEQISSPTASPTASSVMQYGKSELYAAAAHSTLLPSALVQSPSSGVYPPIHGGPFYWYLRNSWSSTKKKVRRINRAWDLNWELGRSTFCGVPKFSYNPKANEWIYSVDNEEWNGVGGRVWIAISMQLLWFFHWAFWSYFMYYRWLVNGKLNVISKWKERY